MLDPAKEFKEHMWPYEVDHRGAEEGGAAYFGKGKSFGYFTTTSGGWQLDGEPYTVGEGSEFQWFRSRIIGGRTNHYGRMSFRFSDYDFKPYDRDGLGTNWPISYRTSLLTTTRLRHSSESPAARKASAARPMASFTSLHLPKPMRF